MTKRGKRPRNSKPGVQRCFGAGQDRAEEEEEQDEEEKDNEEEYEEENEEEAEDEEDEEEVEGDGEGYMVRNKAEDRRRGCSATCRCETRRGD